MFSFLPRIFLIVNDFIVTTTVHKMRETNATGLPRSQQPYLLSFREQRDIGERPKKQNLTVDQFVSLEYLPYIKRSLKSWETSERMLRCYVSPFFGHRQLCDIKRTEIQAWQRNMLKEGYSISTSNRSFAALRALCTYAELLGYLPFGMSPCYKVTNIPQRKRKPYIAPPDKINQMLDALRQNGNQAARALMLLILTDARKNEILKAKWSDVDWENKKLRSPRNTRGMTRFIDLPQEAVELLSEMKMNSRSEWIFQGRNSEEPLTCINYFWYGFREEMGVPQMMIDDLRHNNSV